MFSEEINKVIGAGQAKVRLLKTNKLGYFVSSMLAGAYVGLGIILIFTIGGLLNNAGSPATKIVMGLSFGVALSLVVFAGSELFTGNNFIMASASLSVGVSWKDTAKVWAMSFVGNLTGSILTGYLFYLTGLASGPVGEFIGATTQAKMNIPLIPLFVRGVFCNVMVCLAVWCTFRCKEEAAKLIMIFWCLFVFITAGFEHSVANMTLLTIGLLAPNGADVSLMGYIYNIGIVTLGNMVGGIVFMAIPYYIISKNVKEV